MTQQQKRAYSSWCSLIFCAKNGHRLVNDRNSRMRRRLVRQYEYIISLDGDDREMAERIALGEDRGMSIRVVDGEKKRKAVTVTGLKRHLKKVDIGAVYGINDRGIPIVRYHAA